MKTLTTKRYVHEVVELDRNCEVGECGERAVVMELDGRYMKLLFPNRGASHRVVWTGADYTFLRSAK